MSMYEERRRQHLAAEAWLQDQFRRFDELPPEPEYEEEPVEAMPGVTGFFHGAVGALAVAAVWALTMGELLLSGAAAILAYGCACVAQWAKEWEA